MAEEIKSILKNKIFLAVMSILLGVILIVRQRAAIDSIVMIVGIILLVFAAIFLITFLVKAEKHASQLILAIVFFIIGLLFTIRPTLIVNLFPIIMGIILIISGLADLAHALTSSSETSGKGLLLLVSILVIALGVLAIFQPSFIANALALFIGLCLLFNGIFDLILLILIKKDEKE